MGEGAVSVRKTAFRGAALAAIALAVASCDDDDAVKDEAAEAGIDEAKLVHASVTGAADDYFREMDGGIELTPAERAGRIMWLVWSGGNDHFWDGMVKPTFGTFDLLKIVAAPPGTGNGRPNRWKNLGVVNEPCFRAAGAPDPRRYGLWLDVRDPSCPPDPFADEKRFPGVKFNARGKTVPVGSYYGYPTGIVGLRLFPNPAFDEKAAKHWGDGSRYYSDPKFYNDKDLVRPFRVGMSCAFCHVGPSPVNPPADPEAPAWSNLSSTVGAQYLWMDRIFYWDWEKNPRSFLYEWLHTFQPGTMDTSLVSTDNINNPRTMNAIYDLPARLDMGYRIGQETLTGGALDNMQFNAVSKDPMLTRLYEGKGAVRTPRVLKDGSDSVGALGALNRVYLNIGLYSEEWLRHFNPVIGGKTVSPIRIADARARSPYWQATEKGTPATALFFLKAGRPDRLAAAPGGAAYLSAPPATLARGRQVFADNCARCHSSKGPMPPKEASLAGASGPGYLGRFKAWWRWTQTPGFKAAMRQEVEKPDFLQNNYLSTEARIPVTLLRTNLCSPLATNAIRNNIWDNFSSESYKTLPSVGWSSYNDPYNGERRRYRMPAGGRGYTRPPSLISLWSTSPFLLNNRVGKFNSDPSVSARVASFDLAIRQMLWPQTRDMDAVFGNRVEGVIDRTSGESHVFIPETYFPIRPKTRIGKDLIQKHLGQWIDKENHGLSFGPIPKGTPISALTNLNPRGPENDDRKAQLEGDVHQLERVIGLMKAMGRIFIGIKKDPPADEKAMLARFEGARPWLRSLSKCRDFVVNRGHYFGTDQFVNRAGLTEDEQWWIGNETPLGNPDKEALIAFLKTF
jgi:mono/diheme cytochrome c family protein